MSFTLIRGLFAGNLPELVMFDLDGTLLDSVPDIARAVDTTLAQYGLPACGVECVRSWVGRGSRQLLKDAFAHAGGRCAEADLERALSLYLESYLADCCRESRLLGGATALLHALGHTQIALACVTNKPIAITERVLDHFGLRPFFDAVIGGDSGFAPKPDPASLLHLMAQFCQVPRRALMVGDSRHDVGAARAAGVPVICVAEGYNHGEDIALARPDRVIRALDELI